MKRATLRQVLARFFRDNPENALQILNSQGFSFTKEEESDFRNGNFDSFSDEQLNRRFNSKVLGALGIDPGTFFSSNGKH